MPQKLYVCALLDLERYDKESDIYSFIHPFILVNQKIPKPFFKLHGYNFVIFTSDWLGIISLKQ